MTDVTFEAVLWTAWSLVCLIAAAGVIGLLFHNQLIRWGRRLRAALAFPARHRLTVKETPVYEMPEAIRALLGRQRQDPQEGRGRHWAADAIHGQTMALPTITLDAVVDSEVIEADGREPVSAERAA